VESSTKQVLPNENDAMLEEKMVSPHEQTQHHLRNKNDVIYQ
jgi:hypothetical protein